MEREVREATEPVDSSFDVDDIVLLFNPYSSRYHALQPYINELKTSHYGNRVTEIETEKQHYLNEAALRKSVKENSYVVVAGGDGTARSAAKTIVEYFPNKGVKLLILPGGSASDLSYSVHGPGQLPSPSHILDNSRIQSIRTIDISTVLGTKKSHDIALGYAGFGMTAHAAQTLNSRSYRSRPYARNPLLVAAYESIVAANSILQSRPFQIEHSGRIEDLTELLFANGSRVAKHFPLPNKLEEDQIFMARLEADYRFKKLASWIGSVVLQRQPNIEGVFLHDEPYTFNICGPVPMQLDGEPQDLHPDTQVTIKQSDTSLDIVKHLPREFSEAA